MNAKSTVARSLVVLTGIGALAAALSAPAFAMPMGNDYGTLVQGGHASREVTLADGAKYLNVQRNETVKINVGGKSFTWQFDTLGTPVIKLSDIAPSGIDAKNVTVYVSLSPSEAY